MTHQRIVVTRGKKAVESISHIPMISLTNMATSAIASRSLLAILAAAFAFGGAATAETLAMRSVCHNSGPHPVEPLGDRTGHSIQVIDSSCIVEGGPLDGAVLTQQVVWEYDGEIAVQLSGHGVYRKPGTLAAYGNTDGTLELQFKEGRLSGWIASGRGRITMATGTAKSLAGREYGWTAKPSGNRTYVIDATFE